MFARYIYAILIGASPPPKDNGSNPSQATNEKIERTIENISTSLKQANEPSQHEKPCPEGDDDRNSDLCAQWKAADAAKSAAKAAWWIGGFGLLVGAFTFAAAVAAAIFAKKAAIETEKGANAAINAVAETREANRISQESAERQQRAYVVVSDCFMQIVSDESPPNFNIDFKNTGTTPAYEPQIRLVWGWFRPDEIAALGLAGREFRTMGGPIGPGEVRGRTIAPDSKEEWNRAQAAYKKGTHSLVVGGLLTYLDIFKRTQEVEFRFLLPANVRFIQTSTSVKDQIDLFCCEVGNSAT